MDEIIHSPKPLGKNCGLRRSDRTCFSGSNLYCRQSKVLSNHNQMGGAVPYPHYVLQVSSFSNFTRSNLVKPISLEETANRHSVLSIRADGNQRRKSSSGRTPKGEGPEDDSSRSFDGKSLSSSKEEILALFKRIRSSISKGESSNSKNRNSKPPEDKPSTDSLLEVLRQSRTRGKGKILSKKVEKTVTPQNDSVKKEDSTELPSLANSKTTRPPSNFTRKSPITAVSSSRDEIVESTSETSLAIEENSEQKSKKFEDMKLAELKEVAKSKGIKGYSKLKKSELVELLIRS